MNKYKKHIKKHWYCFILGPLFMTLEGAGEFILPFINANMINIGAANGDISYILKHGGYMVVIAIGMLVTGVAGAYFAVKGASRMAAGVRQDTFDKIQSFSFTEIDRFSTGSLITRVTNDITQIQNFTQSLLRGMFRSPVMLIGALSMSYMLEPKIGNIIFIVLIFLAIVTFLITKISSKRYSAMQNQLDLMNTGINESIINEKVIKSFVREDHEKEKFKVINEGLKEKSISALKMMMLMHPASTLAVNVTTLIVVWSSGKQVMIGNMEIGTLTAFITYLSQVLMALTFMANIFLQGTRAAASDRRIMEVLEAHPSITDENASKKDFEIEKGKIEFRNVSFRYFKRNKIPVLNQIDLNIKEGSFVGIVGSTGSGKTTMISMISRLYDPDEGEILIDDVDVKEMSLPKLRENVAVVLQKNTLFSGTVAENLRWGNENAIMEDFIKVCKIAQAHSFVSAFPDGYDTEIGQGGANLSGGQKQRLCIARALLRNPRIIIFDDSTSAVDTATDARIRESLKNDLPDTTKIIIAQRISSVMDADQIIVMEEGRIVGNGIHDDLLKECHAYQEIYYSQKEEKEPSVIGSKRTEVM